MHIPVNIPVPSRRLVAAVGGGVLLLAVLGGGLWLWSDVQQRRADAAYAVALARLAANRGAEPTPETRAAALHDLETTLARYPAAPMAAEAALELGNLRYAERDWARARAAWEITVARSRSSTLSRLARTNIGYTWEAEHNYSKAIEAFQGALTGLKPADFYYEELLVDLARVQELAGQKEAAIETYRRLLRDAPRSVHAADVRARLASLGVMP